MKEKISLKILKDKKKDTKKKSNGMTFTYPMFKAKLIFNDKKIEFSKHDFGTTYTTIDFPNKVKIAQNRNEYGEDYCSLGGDLIILKYKLKGKDKIITSIDIIGHDSESIDKTGSKEEGK